MTLVRSPLGAAAVLLLASLLLPSVAASQVGVPGSGTATEVAEVAQGTVGGPVPGTLHTPPRIETLDSLGPVAEQGEHIIVEAGDPLATKFTFTNRGGTLLRAAMMGERYTREASGSATAGVDASKVAAGPIDVISTWDPQFLPFRLDISELKTDAPITRVARQWTTGRVVAGQLAPPGDEDVIAVDRRVREGDKVIIHAPASLANTYEVASVTGAGGIVVVGTLPVADATDVSYTVYRGGAFSDILAADPVFVRVTPEPGLPLSYVWPDPRTDKSSVWIEKRYELGGHGHELQLTVYVHNVGVEATTFRFGMSVSGWQDPNSDSGGSMFRVPVHLLHGSCFTGDGLERSDVTSLGEEAETFPTQTAWIGVDTQYFLLAAAPLNVTDSQCELWGSPSGNGLISARLHSATKRTVQAPQGGCVPGWLYRADGSTGPSCDVSAALLATSPYATKTERMAAWKQVRATASEADKVAIEAANKTLSDRRRAVFRFTLYAGPKDQALLAASAHELPESLDYGILGFIATTMHRLMSFFRSMTGNWTLAIILLTLLVKLVLLPLTNKSFQQMQKMQLLKPELDVLKAEIGDDKEKMQKEMMALWKRHKVNPLGGCLPMVLQMPIWIALYQMIGTSVELYHTPLGLWIHDLSSPDPAFVMPVVLGVLMLAQSHFTTSTGTMDGMQAKFMKYGMPAMFSVFMLFLPSGLVLYILVNTILTLIQNIIIRRRLA